MPNHIITRLTEVMREILVNPHTSGIRLTGDLSGLWKKRIGKYRVLYEISEDENIVVFHTVNLRKKIYR